jgi:hypothetical protein
MQDIIAADAALAAAIERGALWPQCRELQLTTGPVMRTRTLFAVSGC